METLTRGMCLLREYCANRGAASELARRLSIGQATVSHWIHGTRKPDRDNVQVLRDALGIPIESWSQPAKPARQRKAASHV